MVIKRTSVINEILSKLEDNITSGKWQPGDKIDTEVSLSKTFNVSRASIHSAIQHLVTIGVLESFQGKGTYVKSIPISELRERLNSSTHSSSLRKILEFRILLEGEICKDIAGRIPEDILESMESAVDHMVKNVNNPQRFAHYDVIFHCLIAGSTQNEIIIQSLNVICDEMERQNALFHTPETTEEAIKYHRQILAYLRNGNGESACETMVHHLEVTPCDPPFDVSSEGGKLFSMKAGK